MTVDPSTPLLVSFQRFCAENKLDAARFGLEKDGKSLDLSLPLRFSGLPNNCSVDLVERAATAGATVRVALQTAGGQRLQTVAAPSMTLADLLRGFLADGSLVADAPALEASEFAGCAIVYMRSCIAGAALRDTTLAAMGITGGAVSLRLQLPQPAVAVVPEAPLAAAAAVSAVLPPAPLSPSVLPPAVQPPAQGAAPSAAESPSGPPAPLARAPVERTPLPPAPRDNAAPAEMACEVTLPADPPPPRVQPAAPLTPAEVSAAAAAAVAGVRELAFDADASVAFLTLVRVLDNVLARPADASVRRIRLGNATFQARVARFPPAVDALRAAGFGDDGGDDGGAGGGAESALVLSPEAEDRGRIRRVRDVLAAEIAAMGGTAPPVPVVNEHALAAAAASAAAQAAAFDPTRSVIMRVSDSGGLETRTLEGSAAAAAADSPTPMRDEAAPATARPSSAAPAPATQVVAGPAGPLTVPVLRPHAHATPTERRVLELRARAQAAQLAHMPTSRDARIVLFDPEAAAAQEAALLQAQAQQQQLGGGGSGGAPDDDDAMGRDPEAQRLLAQYVRSKISAAAAEQDGRPMMTQAQRDLASASQQRVFTSTVVRVNTPDRSVLSATFSPLEPVSAIHDWVASLLRTGGAPPFFLYTTPPPTLFGRAEGSTIEDARLVPAVVLYLGWGTSPSQRAALPSGGLAAVAYLNDATLAVAQFGVGAPAGAAGAVGASVELRSLGEGIIPPAPGPAASGGAALGGGKRGAPGDPVTTEAMMEAMAARLLGGGGGAAVGLRGPSGGAQAGPGGGSAAAGRAGGAIPSWLQTGGGGSARTR